MPRGTTLIPGGTSPRATVDSRREPPSRRRAPSERRASRAEFRGDRALDVRRQRFEGVEWHRRPRRRENGNAVASIAWNGKQDQRAAQPRRLQAQQNRDAQHGSDAIESESGDSASRLDSSPLTGRGVSASRGLETRTAHRNAARPRIETRARRAGDASCHSRCQSAISGSKTRVTVAAIEPAKGPLRVTSNLPLEPLARVTRLALCLCLLRMYAADVDALPRPSTPRARASPDPSGDKATRQADRAFRQRLLPRLEIALFLHPAERHVDRAALQAAARTARPSAARTAPRAPPATRRSGARSPENFGRSLISSMIIDLTLSKSMEVQASRHSGAGCSAPYTSRQ